MAQYGATAALVVDESEQPGVSEILCVSYCR